MPGRLRIFLLASAVFAAAWGLWSSLARPRARFDRSARNSAIETGLGSRAEPDASSPPLAQRASSDPDRGATLPARTPQEEVPPPAAAPRAARSEGDPSAPPAEAQRELPHVTGPTADAAIPAPPAPLDDARREAAARMTLESAKDALGDGKLGVLNMLRAMLAVRADEEILAPDDVRALDLGIACIKGEAGAAEKARTFLRGHQTNLSAPLKAQCLEDR